MLEETREEGAQAATVRAAIQLDLVARAIDRGLDPAALEEAHGPERQQPLDAAPHPETADRLVQRAPLPSLGVVGVPAVGDCRTETSLMARPDLDLDAGEWIIPAAVTKNGREHRVPLPRAAVQIIREQPRMAGTDLVFPGRGGVPMTGFGARLRPVLDFTAQEDMGRWSLHDLRRTMRTGLGALDVDPIIAELILNHALQGDLAKAYDRHDYWRRRVEAVNRWADHVMGLIEPADARVVHFANGKPIDTGRAALCRPTSPR